jgi:hypothetical protein
MIETTVPPLPDLWATGPAPDQTPLLEQLATLRLENATLRAANAVLHERTRELEARVSQSFSNSSRPPRRTHPRCLRSCAWGPEDANEAANPDTGAPSARCCDG